MIFNSVEFIFIFLPISLMLYYLIRKLDATSEKKIQKISLILISLIFYGYAGLILVPIISVSILINYLAGILIRAGSTLRMKKSATAAGIIFNICLLAYFKYTDFFIENINTLFHSNLPLLHLILPLGISFFTFQQIAYVIDVYRGDLQEHKFLDYALSVLFFAKLAEGPITSTKEFLNGYPQDFKGPQDDTFYNKELMYSNLNKGLLLLSIGLLKKLFIADFIARFPNAGYLLDNLSFADAWLSSLAYTLQLYFDFSGYCDMAIGIALMFQVQLPVNFNSPYKAVNIQDFWQRWHITLSKFLGKYLYIPLGGSRKGSKRTCLNIFLVFLVSGIWHGASWTFILWGCLHGIASIIHKLFKRTGIHINKYFSIFLTFNCVNLFWVFFRAKNIPQALSVIKSMFSFQTIPLLLSADYMAQLRALTLKHNTISMGILAVAFCLVFFTKNSTERTDNMKLNKRHLAIIVLSLVIGAFYITTQDTTSSLYFNF